MKRVALIALIQPGSAQAHGAHAAVAEHLHDFGHAIPGLCALAMKIVVCLMWRIRS